MKPDLDNITAQEKENMEVIQKLNRLVNQERYDEMDELFAEEYVDHNPGWDIDSVEGFKKVIKNGHESFDVHNEIRRMIPDDNMVFSEVKNLGTHKTEVFGCPPTGKETEMTSYEIYRLKDNKIAERWVVSNTLELMKQVGVELPVDF